VIDKQLRNGTHTGRSRSPRVRPTPESLTSFDMSVKVRVHSYSTLIARDQAEIAAHAIYYSALGSFRERGAYDESSWRSKPPRKKTGATPDISVTIRVALE